MKKLILIFLLITCCSKKHEISSSEKISLIKVIDSMYEIDQSRRLYFDKIDSTYNLNKNAFIDKNNQKEILGSKFESYIKSVDSNWIEIKRSDKTNTKKLIEISNRFGFPNNKRLGVYKSKAYLIFVHSPEEFFPEINTLITKEYDEGRISEYKKEYIFWHLNGRKGIPPMSGEDGEAIWN